MKRIISILLSLILVFSVMPVSATAFADDTVTLGNSGTWENGTWEYKKVEGAYRLEISGDGYMDSNVITDANGNESTFAEYMVQKGVQILVVKDGVKSVCDDFMYIDDDTSVPVEMILLPNDLESIGENAFRKTRLSMLMTEEFYNALVGIIRSRISMWISLTGGVDAAILRAGVSLLGNNAQCAMIPGFVTHIGKYAFAQTTNFYSPNFILPKTLTEVSEGLLYGSAVKGVIGYEGIRKINKKAFANCQRLESLQAFSPNTEIYEDEDNPSDNAFGYNADGSLNTKLMLLCLEGWTADDYATRHNLKTKRDRALPSDEGKIKSETSENSLAWHYYKDENIVFYELSDTDNSTVRSQFRSDAAIVTESYDMYSHLDVDKDLKGNIIGITPVTIPLDNAQYNVDVLYLKDGIETLMVSDVFQAFNPRAVVLPDSLTTIDYDVFGNCTRLKSVTIPDSVTTIGSKVFINCPALEGVDLGNGITVIPKDLFYNCKSLKAVRIGTSTETISRRAFSNCVGLEKIEIPDNVNTVGVEAFNNCVNALTIKIGSGVTRVDKDAFSDCINAEKIYVNSEFSARSNGKYAFNGTGSYTDGAELIFGDNVNKVDFSFFKGANIKSVTLGKNVTEITGIEDLDYLEEIKVDDENETFYVENGILYEGTKLVLAPRMLTDIIVKSGTTEIGDAAFYKTHAKSVKLPQGVTKIGNCAFSQSEYLKSVTLNRGVTSIGECAFEFCTKLRAIYMPSGLKTIGRCAFEGCTILASVILNEQLEVIDFDAFRGCEALRGIVIPQSVQRIGIGAFENCSTLEYAYIWDSVIEEDAFAGDELVEIFTMLASSPYEYAKLNGIKYTSYTDEDAFFTEAALKLDAEAGYVGYCNGEHGDIEWITVYESDCENDGYMIGVCEYCSEVLEERHIDAYGHDYKKVYETAPTETVRGGALYTCTRCHCSKYEYSGEPSPSGQTISTQTVTGSVIIANNSNATTGRSPAKKAWIMNGDNKLAETDENGNFSLTLESGVYYLKIHYAFGFDRYFTVVVEDEDIDCGNIAIIGADFNKDGEINDEDTRLFRIVLSAVRDDPSYLEYVDLNNDGTINAKDLVILKNCSGLNASEYEYEELLFKKTA